MKKLWRDIKLVYIKLQCWWAIKRVDIKLARLDIKLRRKSLLEKKQHD
jgi:hypothetical protein